MARPVKNNCEYFPHDANMRNHRKVKAIRVKFPNGYAIWSMLIEYLTDADGNEFENSELEKEIMAGDFGFQKDEVSQVIDFCLKLEMLFEKNGFIYSESLNEKLLPVYEKRGKAREISKKQLRSNGQFVISNTDGTEFPISETPQSKENRIEVDNKNTTPTALSIEDRYKNFEEQVLIFSDQYGVEMCKAFINHWGQKGKVKIAFEKEKTFEIAKRLATWKGNNDKWYGSKNQTNKQNPDMVYVRSQTDPNPSYIDRKTYDAATNPNFYTIVPQQ